MRNVSSQFLTAVQSSHTLAVVAEVIDSAGTVTPVDIIEGTVTLDQKAAVRGRCDLTVVDDGTLGLVPDSPASLLAPYGNELRVSRGVQFPDGTSELVSLGVFRFQATEVEDSPDGLQIRLSGQDRAARFIDARFEEPYQVAAGTNYATAILTVLQAAWPDVPTDFTSTALTSPQLVVQEQDDRWQFAQAMAQAISMSLYFDGDGTLVLAPDVLSDPVASVTEGTDGVLLTAGRHWTREGAFNRVICTGENTGEDVPVRGVATDDNPLSPTYYFGPFGKVPQFYSSSFLTTDAQAAAAAQAILNKQLGTTEQVNFGSLVLPHLEPGDTVRVTRARAGINEEDHVLDGLTVPLSAAGAMSAQTRARQVTS